MGHPYSNTGERGWREVISDMDPGGGGDPDGTGGGVLASLGEELPSAKGKRGRLVPLLSSITGKLRAGERETLSKRRNKEKECEMVPSVE
jgi:hypothetical protein